MRKVLLTLMLLIEVHFGNAQNNEILADSYYKKGEFKKALIIYQNLLKEKPYSYNYIFKVVDTHQQLEQFDMAEDILVQKLAKRRNPTLIVELGYNYQLRDSLDKAHILYDEAIAYIDEKPNYHPSKVSE